MTKEPETLTDDEVILLAKWLGAEKVSNADVQAGYDEGVISEVCSYYDFGANHPPKVPFHFCKERELRDWLNSAEGERALMDKVNGVLGRNVEFIKFSTGIHKVKIWPYHENINGEGTTRIHALQRACLEVIKHDK